MPCRPDVRGPFPHIADKVAKARSVITHLGAECGFKHRRGEEEPILAVVANRELSLPQVGFVNTARSRLLTPGVACVLSEWGQGLAVALIPARLRRGLRKLGQGPEEDELCGTT